jgi:hypothetical protein
MTGKLLIVSLVVSQFLLACASSKPKTVDEVYEKYGSKPVIERPYSDEEIRYQEQARQEQEKGNLQKALEVEKEKNRVLQAEIQKEEVKPIRVAPSRSPAVVEPGTEEEIPAAPVSEPNPASQDLNFSNPLGE